MAIEFRYYQEEAIQSLFKYFMHNEGNPLIAAPTGTGKSVIIAGFCQRAKMQYPQTRIMVATHSQELIQQNAEKMLKLWPTAHVGVYSAALKRKDVGASITFAGIGSVARHPEKFGRIDILIIDECHKVGDKETAQYVQFINALKTVNPYLKVVGLTATPYRSGMGKLTLGGIFTDICYDLTSRDAFNRLLAEGYLCRLVPKQTSTVLDVSGVATRGSDGDFVEKALQAAVDRDEITYAAVKESIALGATRKHWLVFASGVEHAQHIAEMLNSEGVPSAVVTGELDKETRERILYQFKSGKIRAVVNNNVLTTGFDFPGIDLILMLRPTRSTSLWVQMLGRGTRPEEGKEDCLVLDFARNTLTLGPINDPVLPKPKKKRGEDDPSGKPPVKVCPTCGVYNHSRATICSACGELFPKVVNITTSAGTSELIAASASIIPVATPMSVMAVAYRLHRKKDRPNSMRVSYICGSGLTEISEYVHFEGAGLARTKAEQWWARRTVTACPKTSEEAVLAARFLPKPVSLGVWMKHPYPEVLTHEFA